MCVSRDRERDSLVNTKYMVLYICRTILIEKIIPFYRSNLFSKTSLYKKDAWVN